MKGIKSVMALAVGAAVTAAIYLTTSYLSASRADDQPAKDFAVKGVEARGSTRVACVNVITVFQQFEKAKAYKQQMEKLLEPYKTRSEQLRKKIAKLRLEQIEKPDDEGAIETAAKKLERELEDVGKEVIDRLSKKNEQHVVDLYREMTQAVDEYAKKQGIDLVLCFGENMQQDLFTFANVSRKVQGMEQGGSVSPMYMARGVDISVPVANMLNRAHKAGGKGSITRE